MSKPNALNINISKKVHIHSWVLMSDFKELSCQTIRANVRVAHSCPCEIINYSVQFDNIHQEVTNLNRGNHKYNLN